MWARYFDPERQLIHFLLPWRSFAACDARMCPYGYREKFPPLAQQTFGPVTCLWCARLEVS